MNYYVMQGNCLRTLKTLPDKLVNTVVTSPPYFGLRDYGHAEQIGLEKTPEAFVEELVKVFREVRRVLRDDGTVWLNLGDSYAGYHGNKNHDVPSSAINGWTNGTNENLRTSTANKNGLKQKDLIGIPWRVAFALQADGWYLRQDIIWHKPNPMPESVTDRCTKAHEYIFLLSKSVKYFMSEEGLKEPAVSKHLAGNITHKYTDAYEQSDSEEHRTKAGLVAYAKRKRNARDNFRRENSKRGNGDFGQAASHRSDQKDSDYPLDVRNRRSVWTIATKPYREAHFATFPPELIRPCILAGSPKDGIVLDPFGGSGTTGMVALQESRKVILCELNSDYIRRVSLDDM